MRRAVFAVVVFLLVGCGGGTPIATPTIALSPTVQASPTVDTTAMTAASTASSASATAQQATITRGVELVQLAALTPTPLAVALSTQVVPIATPTAIPATATVPAPPTAIRATATVPAPPTAVPATSTVPRATSSPVPSAMTHRVALSHVAITLPAAIDPTDVGNGSSASFFCSNGGSATCRLDIGFQPKAARANDSTQAESSLRIVLKANLDANQTLWSEFSSFAHTTRTGLSGITTTYQLRDRYGTGYVYDTFSMADSAGNVRTVGFQYQGGTDRPVFKTGQIDWYAMLDSMTTN